MTIAIDFDGTIVEHRYPKIGNEIPFATDTLKMLMKDHHRLILWTVREGELLKEAVEWCRERGVEFYAINRDYPEEDAAHHGFSRKVKADIFIDDRNLGGLPDWGDIYRMIQKKLTYEELYRNMDEAPQERKAGSGAGLVFRSALKNQGEVCGNEVRLSFRHTSPPFLYITGQGGKRRKASQ